MYFVFLIIFFSILHQFNGQINILEVDQNIVTQGERLILSDTNTFPLINSDNYWSINVTDPQISFEFATEYSTFNYLISSIQIQIFTQFFSMFCTAEIGIDPTEYLLYYQVGLETRVINLGYYNWTVSGDIATLNIEPFPADRIVVSFDFNYLKILFNNMEYNF